VADIDVSWQLQADNLLGDATKQRRSRSFCADYSLRSSQADFEVNGSRLEAAPLLWNQHNL
jgi:hypothetical protein